jgi:hypothetical protein
MCKGWMSEGQAKGGGKGKIEESQNIAYDWAVVGVLGRLSTLSP